MKTRNGAKARLSLCDSAAQTVKRGLAGLTA